MRPKGFVSSDACAKMRSHDECGPALGLKRAEEVTRSSCKTWWVRVHIVRTVRTVLGNYTPQTDPHRRALDSNIDTKKTAGKWVSRHSLVV